MSFHVRLPAGLADFGGHDDDAVVFRPCLKIPVHAGIDPVPVLRDGYLAVVRRDRLRDPAKVGQRIVVDPDPVRDVAAGHISHSPKTFLQSVCDNNLQPISHYNIYLVINKYSRLSLSAYK